MAKKKAAPKKARTTLQNKTPDTKRLSRRKRSDLKRYDQTLSSALYDELMILAKQAETDLRVYVEVCLRNSPEVQKHLKENDLVLPDRPARGNPASAKK